MSEVSDGIGREFMRLTQHRYLPPSAQSQGLPQPALELPYPLDAPLIALPDPKELSLPPLDLRQVIEQRVTVRTYAEEPLSLGELSFLLWATQGVKEVTHRPVTLRTVPSAGARHAFETYLLVNRVEGLQAGLYRYVALENALLPVRLDAEMVEVITKGCYDQRQVRGSAVTFIWVAITERMTWRYGERGYRYLLLDAGHVCQNLYLAAEPLNCGVCAIAAYEDEVLNQALGLDGEAQFVIYLASLGRRTAC
ncbi:MAG: SagB/ThcOx family dehydrogenase [Anaerolinea sp.]|nr:SagB/ThcOx family dehydrogenase [Anaerolinea sp.]